MKVLNVLFRRGIAAPVLALIFASVICISVVTGRVLWTGNMHYALLIWNLFLAWLPMVFALLACDQYCKRPTRSAALLLPAGAWLLFFPNAPYIFTDLIHLNSYYYAPYVFVHFWVDLVLILMCALTGLVLGFVSLYVMQSIVAGMFGRAASWLFIAVAVGLGSFGIYLGRFLRFNSWDVLHPGKIYQGVGAWASAYTLYPLSISFVLLFAGFLFMTYMMLYALTHLSPAHVIVSPSEPQPKRGI